MKDRVLIIAEAGVNHNGSLKKAIKLIDIAAEAGADIVKFQTFQADSLATKYAPKAKYQISKKTPKETQYQMLKKLELKREYHSLLIKHAKKKNIEFLSSGFDVDDLNFLAKLSLKRFKVPSGEITNYLYLKKVASFKKDIILSTGMANIQEIVAAIKVLCKSGLNRNQITILHCSTEYPAKFSGINLNALNTLKKKLKTNIGYSDHTLGLEVAVAAVALGARVIEKHITINKNLLGPDHRASLNPKEFQKMVTAIRNIEKSMGNGKKIPNSNEKKNLKIVRKSIVAKKNIDKGEFFSLDNITSKRPGTGMSPMNIEKLLGKKSKKKYSENQMIKYD
jgi:N,N'-diacetyllegionaminate synthase